MNLFESDYVINRPTKWRLQQELVISFDQPGWYDGIDPGTIILIVEDQQGNWSAFCFRADPRPTWNRVALLKDYRLPADITS